MTNAKTLTRSRLAGAAAKSAERPQRKSSKPPRAGTVVVAEGQKCMRVPLTKGQFALIDMEDAPKILRHCWMAYWHRNTFYARRMIRRNRQGKRGYVWMHREIIGCPKGFTRDHKNRNGLDNRKDNLRIATNAIQRLNTRKASGTSSRFRGVSRRYGRGKPWTAVMSVNGKSRYLGTFDDEQSAAVAYDNAARSVWGELATLNFGGAQ